MLLLLTEGQLERIHAELDSATEALGEASDAMVLQKLEDVRAAIFRAVGHVGSCKDVLREASIDAKVRKNTGGGR